MNILKPKIIHLQIGIGEKFVMHVCCCFIDEIMFFTDKLPLDTEFFDIICVNKKSVFRATIIALT